MNVKLSAEEIEYLKSLLLSEADNLSNYPDTRDEVEPLVESLLQKLDGP